MKNIYLGIEEKKQAAHDVRDRYSTATKTEENVQEISTFVGQFVKDSGRQRRIIAVLQGLPTAVVHDLLSDERFTMVEFDPQSGQGAVFPVATLVKHFATNEHELARISLGSAMKIRKAG